ncbi:MAG: ester cyclase [Roseiflexaceae bacterium]|nr:ester cyclase [Roseiflexaceae bacterium]
MNYRTYDLICQEMFNDDSTMFQYKALRSHQENAQLTMNIGSCEQLSGFLEQASHTTIAYDGLSIAINHSYTIVMPHPIIKGVEHMSEANKATVRRLIEEVQNRHDLAQMDAFFAPNFINHLEAADLSTEHTSVERAKITFRAMFAAFPDLHVTIQDQVAEGDKVVTHKLFQGTHHGTFMGVAPTGRQIAFAVIDILRLDNDKVVEHWAIQDRLALMQQLGMLPVPE